MNHLYSLFPGQKISCKILTIVLILFLAGLASTAQPVTGVWRGRIIRGSGLRQSSAPFEIKLVAQGDSIVGTSYYYGSGKSYVRYSVKGYFGQEYNTVIWKDYHMVEMYPKQSKEAKQFSETMRVEADYSCPDGKTLRLDGVGILPGAPDTRIELKKMDGTLFPDEWDEVIAGYFYGMARKEVVDSVWAIASEPYVPKTSATRVSDDIAANPTAPKPNTASGKGAAITARPGDVVKLPPVTPPATPPVEKTTDTLVVQPAPAAVAVTTPPQVEKTSTAIQTATPTRTDPPPATVAQTPPPAPTNPKPAPKPVTAPQDITAEISRQQRQQSGTSQTGATAQVKAAPEKPVTTTTTATTTSASASSVPPPATSAANRQGGAIIANPDKPVYQPIMMQAFSARRKVVQSELPLLGDSIELRFYDNAEVDGDSISLFLNGVALFQHVRLDARPYTFKIPVTGLPDICELAMVAENLGAIPPNTAFMEAFVQGRRYSARLESTEQTSAVIRLVRKE